MEDGAEPFRVLCTLANEREQDEFIGAARGTCPNDERVPGGGGSTGRGGGASLGVSGVSFKNHFFREKRQTGGSVMTLLAPSEIVKYSAAFDTLTETVVQHI